ncbi:hypothetical protein PRZ48_003283 [Zasmidium cellare]|uniref:Micro-fibrillar-associated protein 1 C-terminal domain-containing protein n=1 Tax=Zasmidium cellare TaxID=395010 RepID=A0ABR0EW54_ZASCE|nr:hypothetical protein PRZ48_003283 [Zasmidium cellare]
MAPPSRMTKQPDRSFRYYPGKAQAEDPVSEEESDEESEEEQKPTVKAPPPKASSFPKQALAIQPGKFAEPALPKSAEPLKEDDLEGFVTASESSDGEGDNGSEEDDDEEESSEEEDSSSDDEPKKPMLRPTFMSKAQRAKQQATAPSISAEEQAAEEERKRKEKADELLQAQIERDAEARKAGKKYWDDDDVNPEDEVDDNDDADPEADRAAWKLRELKRVKRDREALIAKEKEREEVERRRNMTAEEREAEDREFLEKQAEEREDKGKMAYMQKYFHKGAFFNDDDQDEEVKQALSRDIAGHKFVDDAGDKAVLPEYMRIRDMTKLGKKGRTKYKDLKNEDTGRWGQFEGKKRDFDGLDDRFRPDDKSGGGREKTGANAAPIGERRRREDDDGREVDGKRARHS